MWELFSGTVGACKVAGVQSCAQDEGSGDQKEKKCLIPTLCYKSLVFLSTLYFRHSAELYKIFPPPKKKEENVGKKITSSASNRTKTCTC